MSLHSVIGSKTIHASAKGLMGLWVPMSLCVQKQTFKTYNISQKKTLGDRNSLSHHLLWGSFLRVTNVHASYVFTIHFKGATATV